MWNSREMWKKEEKVWEVRRVKEGNIEEKGEEKWKSVQKFGEVRKVWISEEKGQVRRNDKWGEGRSVE